MHCQGRQQCPPTEGGGPRPRAHSIRPHGSPNPPLETYFCWERQGASRASPAPRSSRNLVGLAREEKTTPSVLAPQKRSFQHMTCGLTAWPVSQRSVKDYFRAE